MSELAFSQRIPPVQNMATLFLLIINSSKFSSTHFGNSLNESESLWDGECFVFDDRVSIKHGLVEGDFSLCHACRMPISEEDIASDEYIEGISCPNCFGTHSEEKKKRFAERQKQIKLAKQRGEKHIGKIY